MKAAGILATARQNLKRALAALRRNSTSDSSASREAAPVPELAKEAGRP